MTTNYFYGATLSIALCACVTTEEPTLATAAQEGQQMQGQQMQGQQMQGQQMQGMQMQGMQLGSVTLSGDALQNVRVDRGELVAERYGTPLRDTDLIGAHLIAEVRNLAATPARAATVEYRITAIEPEDDAYDPTDTGHTYLYTLEQWVEDTGTWRPACPADADGRRVAIPLAATWDERGDRITTRPLFTFACTTGVIAKCYRWGYRPWVTGYGDLVEAHWACTRMARADYCGNGIPHTRNGTTINVWDDLPGRGPIQKHGLLPPLGMLFEAGWDTHGAVCLSHARWLLDNGGALASLCPDRLVPPGLLGTVCDTVGDVLDIEGEAVLYNEAYLNL